MRWRRGVVDAGLVPIADEASGRAADGHAAGAHEALGHHDRAWEELAEQAAWPPQRGVTLGVGLNHRAVGQVPDGLAPTSTTGGTYSIGRALMPVGAVADVKLNGITRSTGAPPGAKKAAYASPLTRAVTTASKLPASS